MRWLALGIHLQRAVLVGPLRREADVYLPRRVVAGGPLLVERIQLSRPTAVPTVAVAALLADILQPSAWYTVAVADIRLTILQIVVSCPQRLAPRIVNEPCFGTTLSPSGAHQSQARQLIFIKPAHGTMYRLSYPFVGVGQFHQQPHQRGTLLWSVRRQFVSSCLRWQQRDVVVLLAPDGRLAVHPYLGSQDAFHTLVECPLHALPQSFVGQFPLEGHSLLSHVAQHLHRVVDSIVVEGDMLLISLRMRPELRPTAIVILSAQQKLHTTAERFGRRFVTRLLVEAGQKSHLLGGSSVVDGRVVGAQLVGGHLSFLLVGHRRHHVDVLWPSPRAALPQHNLLSYAPGLVGLEEVRVCLVHLLSPRTVARRQPAVVPLC